MGAISAALFATLKSGARLLIPPSDGYYVTRVLSAEFLAGFGGVEVTERPPTAQFSDGGGFDGFDVVFLESPPSNPGGLEVIDLAAIAAEVRNLGGITICDNTTMTPPWANARWSWAWTWSWPQIPSRRAGIRTC